ncbi:MAG TPA: 30S ribosome-binding factor RbfA [Methylophilaceae bacterium]|nr:30S ribosome-binding factor RbfA [Methylophilaceae bacterium]
MAKDFSRSDRISEQIRRELADLLQFEVKDPRVSMVTITEVEVSGDIAHAKIYFSAPVQDNPQALAELQKGLDKSAGFLRSQLGKRMMVRTVPQLHFIYDTSIDHGMKISRLIDEALAQQDKPKSN